MKLPQKITVTDYEIDISKLSNQQVSYYRDLAKNIADSYVQKGEGRQIYTLSGPSGSGKSVLAKILAYLMPDMINFYSLGIDAYHFPNDVLIDRNIKSFKGRFDTYDTDKLSSDLKRFKAGETVAFPRYSRNIHNPMPDAFRVDKQNCLLFLEGLWLLSNEPGWKQIRPLYTYNYFVRGPAEAIHNNVVERHIIGGRSEAEAQEYYENSDAINAQKIIEYADTADEEITYFAEVK